GEDLCDACADRVPVEAQVGVSVDAEGAVDGGGPDPLYLVAGEEADELPCLRGVPEQAGQVGRRLPRPADGPAAETRAAETPKGEEVEAGARPQRVTVLLVNAHDERAFVVQVAPGWPAEQGPPGVLGVGQQRRVRSTADLPRAGCERAPLLPCLPDLVGGPG